MALYGESEWNLGFTSGTLCSSSTCEGDGSVYRVSFLLFLYYLIHLLVVAFGKIDFHWMWNGVKFCVFAGCVTLTFIYGDSNKSNSFFYGYAIYFARYVSGLYLLLQIMILLAWAYKLNDEMVAGMNAEPDPDNPDEDATERRQGAKWHLWGLVSGSIVLYLASFVLSGLFFIWYGDVDSSECATHRTFIGVSIVLIVINAVASGAVGNGTFFVSAGVSFYMTFLLFSALQADDDDTCNIWAGQKDTASLWIGYVVVFMTVFYAAYRADQMGILLEPDEPEEPAGFDMETPLLIEQAEAKKAAAEKEAEERAEADKNRDASMLSNKESNYDDVDEENQEPGPDMSRDGRRLSNS